MLSFGIGLVAAVFVLGLPALVGYGGCTALSWLGLCSPTGFLIGVIEAMLIFAGIVGVAGLVLWYVVRALPPGVAFVLAVLILAAGLLLFQPELDAIGAVTFVLALMEMGGDKRAGKARKALPR